MAEQQFKYRLHRLLAAEPELLRMVESEALGLTSRPTDALDLAYREGRRHLAAEWLSLYREVENERTRVGG